MPIDMLLANRQSLFREAVREALSDRHDIEIVCEAATGLEAIEEAERHRPNVALVDAGLELRSTSQVVVGITKHVPSCRVIVLGELGDLRTLIEAVQAGASGYISRDLPLSELTQTILNVHAGDLIVPPRMLGPLLSRLVQRHQERDEALRTLARLTRREREVLFLLTRGANHHAIAECLVISPQTARTHIQNVLAKLKVHSRIEATVFVVRNGMVDYLAEVEGSLLAGLTHGGLASVGE